MDNLTSQPTTSSSRPSKKRQRLFLKQFELETIIEKYLTEKEDESPEDNLYQSSDEEDDTIQPIDGDEDARISTDECYSTLISENKNGDKGLTRDDSDLVKLLANELYLNTYPERRQPEKRIFQTIKNNLVNYGSFKKPRPKHYNIKDEKEIEELNIIGEVLEDPNTSLRTLAERSGKHCHHRKERSPEMEEGSSQESEWDKSSQEGFKTPKSKKRGRKPKTATPSTPTTPTPDPKRPAFYSAPQPSVSQNRALLATTTTTKQQQQQQKQNPTFTHTFTVVAPTSTTRIQFALEWEKISPDNKDIIIKQERNLLIKTNNEGGTAEALQMLTQREIITSFKINKTPTAVTNQTNTVRRMSPSYSVVATGVDLDITDCMFLKHLEKLGLNVRFCRRIISRQRSTPTLMMRLITGDLTTYEKLINDRAVHFLGRLYRIVESKPPAPIPVLCSKCNFFEHRSEDCKVPTKCNKCQGPHPTATCKSPLPPRCTACNSEDHAAWSMKCPKRPTAPIDGIPNVKIKCLNRRTAEVSIAMSRDSRIHSAITTHDYIINKYKNQINKTTNTDREELLKKLRKQFVGDFAVDTSVVFFGNNMYILMFDMLSPSKTSPTELTEQLRQTITNTEHSI
ncbi:uncharacterized protein [Euwallacea similis]|uniref:uncharacterized protein n=1 Tax=Euwallacea similis TaxID=1736056 RepID=UPI00344C0D44